MATNTLDDVRAQLLLWGWCIVSTEPDPREALRNPASILEGRDAWPPAFHSWDRKPIGWRYHGDRAVAIPDWWALHYLPLEWIGQALDDEAVVEAAERIVEGDG